MATIAAVFENISGESQISDYENAVEAFGISEAIHIAEAGGGGRKRGARTVGRGTYGNLTLSRLKDSASPKLATAASSGQNIGTVRVVLFRTLEAGIVPFMNINLDATIVAGYDLIEEDGRIVENVSLSTPRVSWTYTEYQNGAESGSVAGGWDQQRGIELA